MESAARASAGIAAQRLGVEHDSELVERLVELGLALINHRKLPHLVRHLLPMVPKLLQKQLQDMELCHNLWHMEMVNKLEILLI